MSRHLGSLPNSYFEALYRARRDPWHFEDSDYEQQKYVRTLDALGDRHFARALEIGCSIGVLTQRLASHCDHLLSVDVSEEALQQARNRCAECDNVELRLARAPDEWPQGTFDLVMLSEVLYYFSEPDVTKIARRTTECLRPDGVALLVHWVGETDYPLSGGEAAEAFLRNVLPDLGPPVLQVRQPEYRLDLLRKASW